MAALKWNWVIVSRTGMIYRYTYVKYTRLYMYVMEI